MELKQEMAKLQQTVEARLGEFFPEGGLQEAMRYSLLAGGKRIRPILCMQFCAAAGAKAEDALDFGCGVEMLHTYSLIHDDLPCMDNDDLRRGKPTNHKVFGECIATLAGDALQAAAFSTVLGAAGEWRMQNYAPAMAAKFLADAAGEQGMCGGQYLDTYADGSIHTAEELSEINNKKTGALLRAACMMGVAAAAGKCDVDEGCFAAAEEYATKLGLAFQIRDDMLDVVGDVALFGKPIGSDAEQQKSTYVSILGLAECERLVAQYTLEAKEALLGAEFPGGTEFLTALADQLATRSY